MPNEASIECWVVWQGGGVWQEMFDFGAAATPGVSNGGGTYFMISPHDGNTGALHSEWFPGGLVLTGPSLQVGVLSQVVLTHDQDRQLDKLYLNGQLISSGANPLLWSSLPDTDNWLARDQWPDPMFNGSYADMRIWSGALTSGQVANLYAAGPNVVVGPGLQISSAGTPVDAQMAGQRHRLWFAIIHESRDWTVDGGFRNANRRWRIEQPDDSVAGGSNVLPIETIIRLELNETRPGAATRPAFTS